MKKNIPNIIFLICLGCIITFFALSYLLTPPSSFSEDENRALQTPPRFTLEKLLNGTYTRQLHDYFSDQIAFRTDMISLKANTELLTGKNENNGILLGKDGYLIETHPYTEDNYSYFKKNLAKIEKLISSLEENGVNVHSALIPRKIDILKDKLPPYYSDARNSAIWEEVGERHLILTDALSTWQSSGMEIFYKTDHHWTADGAYYAYETLIKLLNRTPKSKAHFDLQLLSDNFYGTSYSKSGFFFADPDSMFAPKSNGDRYVTTIVDTGVTFDGLYDTEYLSKKDKYSVFLSGNNAHVRIMDMENEEKETLLIIKDSFSHSLAPYLCEHYNIELIDPRYYIGSIEEYIADNGIENVLFLFGLDTLASANISIK